MLNNNSVLFYLLKIKHMFTGHFLNRLLIEHLKDNNLKISNSDFKYVYTYIYLYEN